MKKSNKYKPSMFKYIAIALVIFVVAVIISVATRMSLVSDSRFSDFNDDQASLVTSMIEGAVGAIAAGFVLYQLKGEELAENLENEIHAADFYHHFIDYWLETDRMFIEHPASTITMRLSLVRGKQFPLPLVICDDRLIIIASADTLDEAVLQATRNMIDYLVSFRHHKLDYAWNVLAIAGNVRVCQFANKLKTARCELPLSLANGMQRA